MEDRQFPGSPRQQEVKNPSDQSNPTNPSDFPNSSTSANNNAGVFDRDNESGMSNSAF